MSVCSGSKSADKLSFSHSSDLRRHWVNRIEFQKLPYCKAHALQSDTFVLWGLFNCFRKVIAWAVKIEQCPIRRGGKKVRFSLKQCSTFQKIYLFYLFFWQICVKLNLLWSILYSIFFFFRISDSSPYHSHSLIEAGWFTNLSPYLQLTTWKEVGKIGAVLNWQQICCC